MVEGDGNAGPPSPGATVPGVVALGVEAAPGVLAEPGEAPPAVCADATPDSAINKREPTRLIPIVS